MNEHGREKEKNLAGGFIGEAADRVAADVARIDFPDETGDLLFDLPLAVHEQGDDDGGQEEGTQDAGRDLRVAQSVVGGRTVLVLVAALGLVGRRSAVHPRDPLDFREFLRRQRHTQ